jgi:hypothetical protein
VGHHPTNQRGTQTPDETFTGAEVAERLRAQAEDL